MLRSLNSFRGVDLYATDGHIGPVSEFFFDDRDWTVLYMAAETGDWLPGRRALVPPASVGEVDWVDRRINVMVTREDIKNSPNIDLHQPITREQEIAYFAHFGWACLWDGELRSSSELVGLPVISDGDTCRVEDLVIDDQWTIRNLKLCSTTKSTEKDYFLDPRLIEGFEWDGRGLRTSMNLRIHKVSDSESQHRLSRELRH